MTAPIAAPLGEKENPASGAGSENKRDSAQLSVNNDRQPADSPQASMSVHPIPDWALPQSVKDEESSKRHEWMRTYADRLDDKKHDDKREDAAQFYAQTVQYLPGLVGDIARYVYASSYLPVSEAAVAAALGLMAGICGRSWHTRTKMGLNVYLILLANTGRGKEGMSAGIAALERALMDQRTLVGNFIGPSEFASGQGLIRRLDKSPGFVSVLGEFGLVIKQICSPKASAAQVTLRKVLLDAYGKSGPNGMLRESAYSDTTKNTTTVRAPAVSILGESVPLRFFEGLTPDNVAEGLVPRFCFIEHTGLRPQENDNCGLAPGPDLVANLAALVDTALDHGHKGAFVEVGEDPDARDMLKKFSEEARDRINGEDEVETQLWTRAHAKVMRLAALVAVGCNKHQPVITEAMTTWAIEFVRHDLACIIGRFQHGTVGGGREVRQEADIKRAVLDYLRMNAKQRASYKVPTSLQDQPIAPYNFIRRRVQRCASFIEDPRGLNAALKTILDDLCRADVLERIHVGDASAAYGVSQPLYRPGSSFK